ncbi:MAG: hypothetical protein V1926_06260 [Candidatus Peregrinibacteria bacterium]
MRFVLALIAVLLIGIDAIVVIKLIESHIKKSDNVHVWFQMFSMLIAVSAIFFPMYQNHKQDMCKYRTELTTKIVELTTELSYAIRIDMGIPYICYIPDDRGDLKNVPEREYQIYTKFRLNAQLVKHYMNSMNHSKETADAFNSFINNIKKLESKCGKKDANFHETWRDVDESGDAFLTRISRYSSECFESFF